MIGPKTNSGLKWWVLKQLPMQSTENAPWWYAKMSSEKTSLLQVWNTKEPVFLAVSWIAQGPPSKWVQLNLGSWCSLKCWVKTWGDTNTRKAMKKFVMSKGLAPRRTLQLETAVAAKWCMAGLNTYGSVAPAERRRYQTQQKGIFCASSRPTEVHR